MIQFSDILEVLYITNICDLSLFDIDKAMMLF